MQGEDTPLTLTQGARRTRRGPGSAREVILTAQGFEIQRGGLMALSEIKPP